MCLLTRGSVDNETRQSSSPKTLNQDKRPKLRRRPYSETFMFAEAVQPPGPTNTIGSVDKRAAVRRRMTETNFAMLSRQSSTEYVHYHNIRSSLVSSVQTSPERQRVMRQSRLTKTRSSIEITGQSYNQPLLIKSGPKLANQISCLTFSLAYCKEENKLELHLLNATDLPMKDNGLVDSYATVSLVTPKKKHRRETKVYKKTCNPIFDLKYAFREVCESDLPKSHLQFKVYRRQSSIKSELVGKVVVELAEEGVLKGKQLTRRLVINVSLNS